MRPRVAPIAACLAAVLTGACVHRARPLAEPPPAPPPASAPGELPFAQVLDSSLRASDPGLAARLAALDAKGDHDGVFTRGDAWAADPSSQLFADLHVHPFMSEALKPFFRGTPAARRAASSPTAILHTQVTLPLLERGATNVLFASVYVGMMHVTPHGRMKNALAQIAYAKRFAVAHADRVEIALSAADVRRIVASHRIAIVLCVEGGHVVSRVEDVDRLYDAGVRMMTLVHFTDNAIGGCAMASIRHPENFHVFGCHTRKDGVVLNERGLTPFGRDVVRRMIARGMIVDLAHASDRTVHDVLDLTAGDPVPMLISHTAMRAYHPAERNESDEIVRAIAARGGVVGLTSWRVELVAEGIGECHAFATHFRRLLDLAGPEHVGIGTDFNGMVMRPRPCAAHGRPPRGIGATGLRNVGDMPELYEELVSQGVPPDVLEHMGGNVLRVFEEVENHAARRRGESAPAAEAPEGT